MPKSKANQFLVVYLNEAQRKDDQEMLELLSKRLGLPVRGMLCQSFIAPSSPSEVIIVDEGDAVFLDKFC